MINDIAIYIHIPFCRSKCYYCDFNSYSGKESLIPEYFSALQREIAAYACHLKNTSITSIFIGGGTPSYVDERYISNILDLLRKISNIDPSAEITIESNPGTLSAKKLSFYKSIGINRISLGASVFPRPPS